MRTRQAHLNRRKFITASAIGATGLVILRDSRSAPVAWPKSRRSAKLKPHLPKALMLGRES